MTTGKNIQKGIATKILTAICLTIIIACIAIVFSFGIIGHTISGIILLMAYVGIFRNDPPKKEATPNNGQNTHTAETPIQTGSNPESTDYADLCTSVAERIYCFYHELESNPKYAEAYDRCAGLECFDQSAPVFDGYRNRLIIPFLWDLSKVYRKITGCRTKPSLGDLCPSMIFCKFIKHGLEINRSDIYHIISKVRPQAIKTFRDISGLTVDQLQGPYDFFTTTITSTFDEQLAVTFRTLLYRYAYTIAKSDDIISPAEQKYLSGLMGNTATANDREILKTENKANTPDVPDLDSLIGLKSVKEEVRKLSDYIKIQQLRTKNGLKSTSISYHCVFTGNPGTGKTTVARIIADIYRKLGILKKGHLVETDRSGLVAEYVGQTAVKTNKIIDSALDGVLFIDEAYSLAQGDKNDFGMEAIATLLKRMEDDRSRLVVILAGYSKEMTDFIDTNSGLQSRFNRYIHFPDYNTDELMDIFKSNAARNDYTLTDESLLKLRSIISNAIATKDEKFGNARYARNLFEKTLENQASRLARSHSLSCDSLRTLLPDDICPI